jgi:ParB-like chromosome segregation protein Spo0J
MASALADRALRRLTLGQRRMLYEGKHPNLVNIAIARELVGFVWNVLHTNATAQAWRTRTERSAATTDRPDPEPPRYRYAISRSQREWRH